MLANEGETRNQRSDKQSCQWPHLRQRVMPGDGWVELLLDMRLKSRSSATSTEREPCIGYHMLRLSGRACPVMAAADTTLRGGDVDSRHRLSSLHRLPVTGRVSAARRLGKFASRAARPGNTGSLSPVVHHSLTSGSKGATSGLITLTRRGGAAASLARRSVLIPASTSSSRPRTSAMADARAQVGQRAASPPAAEQDAVADRAPPACL